jgi:CBS domain-containing protein
MNVRDIMTAAVYTCEPDTDLGTVAEIMWNHDCGFVPVVDASGAVMGLITDRDICMAATTRRLAPERIAASQAMSQVVRACLPDDSVSEALAMMKHFKVRRLPVVDPHGFLRGVLSIDDVARAANPRKGLAAVDVVSALAEICEHRIEAGVPR